MDLDTFYIYYNYITLPLCLVPNVLLLYLIYKKTPRHTRDFAVILTNQQISAILILLAQLFLIYKIVPSGMGFIYVTLGPCSHLTRFIAEQGIGVHLSSIGYMIFSTINPFFHRYFLLLGKNFSVNKTILICLITRIPYFIEYFALNVADDNSLLLASLQKDYNMSISGLFLLGTVNFMGSIRNMYFMAITQLVPVFLIISALIIRYKVNRILKDSIASENTKRMHRSLMMAFTIQLILMMIMVIAGGSAMLGLYKIYVNTFVNQYMCMSMTPIILSLSPSISIYFVSYYRIGLLEILRLHSRKRGESVVQIHGPATITNVVSH